MAFSEMISSTSLIQESLGMVHCLQCSMQLLFPHMNTKVSLKALFRKSKMGLLFSMDVIDLVQYFLYLYIL